MIIPLLVLLPFRSNLEEEGDEVEGMAVERKGNKTNNGIIIVIINRVSEAEGQGLTGSKGKRWREKDRRRLRKRRWKMGRNGEMKKVRMNQRGGTRMIQDSIDPASRIGGPISCS